MSMNLQKTITDLRREKGYTQEKLAEMLGVSTAAVSKWENGNSYPDITLLPQLAEIFDVSLDYLFSYDTAARKTIPEVIKEANRISKESNRDASIALIAKTLARYPNNEMLIFELARHKFTASNYKGKKEREVLLQDAEKGFISVAENTDNEERRAWAYHFLTSIAIVQRDYDKARLYNDHIIGGSGLHPKVDRAIIEIMQHDNADALHLAKETMHESIVEYSLMMNWILNYHLCRKETNEAIRESKRTACVLREFNDAGMFDNDLSVIYEGMAWAYAMNNSFEDCITCLEEAYVYAERYDSQENGSVYNVYGIMKEIAETEEKISTRKTLADVLHSNERSEYEPIRNSARFKALLEKLDT